MIQVPETKGKKIITTIYAVSISLLFLKTFYLKFFWNVPSIIFLLGNAIVSLLYFFPKIEYTRRDVNLAVLISIFFLLHVFSNKGEGIEGILLTIINIVLLLEVNDTHKIEIYFVIKIIFAVICGVSLCGWIAVNIFHLQLPMHISQYAHYSFYDYGIFNMRVEGIDFSRYLGMFLEPGYTGIMCILFLCTDRFDFRRWENIVLIVSALFTLSLATYLIVLIYYILYKPTAKKALTTMILFVTMIIIMYILRTVPSLQHTLDYFIFDRFAELFKGNIFGNRFSNDFNYFFSNNILNDPWNLLLGIGSESLNRYGFASAGFKVFIAQDGIMNTILIIIINFLLCIGEDNEVIWDNIVLFLIWLFCFIDISYPTWACFQILMICGSANYRNNRYYIKPVSEET